MNRRTFLAAVAASPVMPAAIRLSTKPCEHRAIEWPKRVCVDCGKELHLMLFDDMKEMLEDLPSVGNLTTL